MNNLLELSPTEYKQLLADKVKHLSASSMGLYETCPRKWAYRYLLGIKDKEQSLNLRVGTAAHKYLELGMSGDVDGEVNIQDDMVDSMEILIRAMDEYISNNAKYSVKTEAKFRFMIDGISIPLYGFIDSILETPRGIEIVDYKTAGSMRSWPTNREWGELQPYLYWMAAKSLGYEPSVMKFVILSKKDGTMADRELFLTNQDLEWGRRRMATIWAKIQMGFIEAKPHQFLCKPNYCPVFGVCAEGRNPFRWDIGQ